MYPSFACQGGGKKSWMSHPSSKGNNRHLGALKKMMHGQSSWLSVKVHHSSFILKKMKRKQNSTNANP
jgi:hypothetical protein